MSNTVKDLTAARQAYQADRLGNIRADIKRLQDEAKDIEGELKDEGLTSVEGNFFHVKINYGVKTTTVDNKNLLKKFCAKIGQEPSHQLVTACTKVRSSDRVTITAYKK